MNGQVRLNQREDHINYSCKILFSYIQSLCVSNLNNFQFHALFATSIASLGFAPNGLFSFKKLKCMHLLYKFHACVFLHMYVIHVLLCLHLALQNWKYICCFREACFIWIWMNMKKGWIGKMAQCLYLLIFWLINQQDWRIYHIFNLQHARPTFYLFNKFPRNLTCSWFWKFSLFLKCFPIVSSSHLRVDYTLHK